MADEDQGQGMSYKKAAILGAAGASTAVLAAPLIIGGVGFGAAGILGGSYAAGWMSAAALAGGGGVVKGSAIAVLQSIGAAGMGATSIAVAGATGAAGALGTGAIYSNISSEKEGQGWLEWGKDSAWKAGSVTGSAAKGAWDITSDSTSRVWTASSGARQTAAGYSSKAASGAWEGTKWIGSSAWKMAGGGVGYFSK